MEEIDKVVNGPEKSQNDALKDKLFKLKIDFKEEVVKPEVAWEIKSGKDYILLGSLGDFSVVTGKAKSKKSFFIAMAVAAASSSKEIQEKFRSKLNHGFKKVLYFDTEQSKYYVQEACERISKMLGNENLENLEVYGLRSESPTERLKLVDYAINNTKDLGFVIIDGIKDLIHSVNDEQESSEVASKLLKWTQEKNIHIVTVLHLNPSNDKMRGHIGTELTNKAETVISVTRDENNHNISFVEPKDCRNKAFESFAFQINDEGLPEVLDDYQKQSKRVKYNPDDMSDEDLDDLFGYILKDGKKLKTDELSTQLSLKIREDYGNASVGKNKMNTLIKKAEGNGVIIKDGHGKPYELNN